MSFFTAKEILEIMEGRDATVVDPVTGERMRAAARAHEARLAGELKAARAARRGELVERLDRRAATVESKVRRATVALFDVLTTRRALNRADVWLCERGLAWAQPLPMNTRGAALSLAWYAAGTFLR